MVLVFQECTITSIHLISKPMGRCRQPHQVGKHFTRDLAISYAGGITEPCQKAL